MFTIPVWGASAVIGGGTLLGHVGKSQEGSRQTFSLQRFGISWGVKGEQGGGTLGVK